MTAKTTRVKNTRKKTGSTLVTPAAEVRRPSRGAARGSNRDKIEHIVVLMMENRSFDHILGYLSLEGRTDVNGLKTGMSNTFKGKTYPINHLKTGPMPGDLCHDGPCVDTQIAGGCGGFVKDYAAFLGPAGGDLTVVMGYHDGIDLPVYRHLADEFLICDAWFSSIAGPTIPNRMYSLAGGSRGMRSNPPSIPPPVFNMPTIFDYLDMASPHVPWKAFAGKPLFSMLRLFQNHRFANIASLDDFFPIAGAGRLPNVTWLEPDYGIGIRATENDDHPPTDILRGQRLVAQVYNTLLAADHSAWERTLFVITYDEHGGLFDHVSPLDPLVPRPKDDPADGKLTYGVRVPAFLISPWVKKGDVSHVVYDHTSILKTILQRFLRFPNGGTPSMHARVDDAAGLWDELSEANARVNCTPAPMPVAQTAPATLSAKTVRALQADPTGHNVALQVAAAQPPLNDFQKILKSIGDQVGPRMPVQQDSRLAARFQ